MGLKFSDFMRELEEETRREGPEAVAAAAALVSALARALGAELGIRIQPGSRGELRARPAGQRHARARSAARQVVGE